MSANIISLHLQIAFAQLSSYINMLDVIGFDTEIFKTVLYYSVLNLIFAWC